MQLFSYTTVWNPQMMFILSLTSDTPSFSVYSQMNECVLLVKKNIGGKSK